MLFFQVPVKALVIDGNCRVEDRGMKAQHGDVRMVLFLHSIFIIFLFTCFPFHEMSRVCENNYRDEQYFFYPDNVFLL